MSESNERTSLTNRKPKTSYMVYIQGASTNLCGICCLVIGNIGLATAALLVLDEDDSDCSTPIRLWLYVYATGAVISVLLLISLACSARNAWTGCMRMTVFFITLYLLFALFWFCIGNYWLYSDTDCRDDFENGFTVTLIIMVLSYISIIMFCCGCSAYICCAGVFGAVLGQTGTS